MGEQELVRSISPSNMANALTKSNGQHMLTPRMEIGRHIDGDSRFGKRCVIMS